MTPPAARDLPERAERKLATVLFADLVSSTERGASEDPERTRVLLDRFYDAMTAELVDAGGTVEKFVGDAVMAAFGVPVAQEDHVERALHAALAMQRSLEQTFGGELSMRIGVNSGEVVVGAARERSSFASGDAVNVAARLEQVAAPVRSSSASGRRHSPRAPSSSRPRCSSRRRASRAEWSAGSSCAPSRSCAPAAFPA